MKLILVIGERSQARKGGVLAYVDGLVTQLTAGGHEATVVGVQDLPNLPKHALVHAVDYDASLALSKLDIGHLCTVHGKDIYQHRIRPTKASTYLANSEYTRNLFKLQTGKTAKVAYHAALDYFNLLIDKPARATVHVASIGALSRHKGHDITLATLREYSKRQQANRVVWDVVLGAQDCDAEYRATFFADVARSQADNLEIRVHTAPDRLRIREILHEADIFALPTRRYGHLIQGFGIAFQEAMRAGCACVFIHDYSLPEHVSGLSCYDEEHFKAVLSGLLDDPIYARTIGRQAIAAAISSFTWVKTIKATYGL